MAEEYTIAEVVRGIADLKQSVDKVTDDHERRIRALERWQYIATGLAAALGSGVGASISSLLR